MQLTTSLSTIQVFEKLTFKKVDAPVSKKRPRSLINRIGSERGAWNGTGEFPNSS